MTSVARYEKKNAVCLFDMFKPSIVCAVIVLSALAACGGGEDIQPQPSERRALQWQVSLYGDSLTANREKEISDNKFTVMNYAIWGMGSFYPLSTADKAKVVVIRYGMADSIREITPQETVSNVLNLAAQVRAKGQQSIIVGMPCLDSSLGAATAEALKAVQDVDVTVGCGNIPRTTDGIHPTPEEHARMDAIIREKVLSKLNEID